MPAKHKKTSVYRGVSYHPAMGSWQARIGFQSGAKFLGYYGTEEEAAAAYDEAAKICRKNPRLNFRSPGFKTIFDKDRKSGKKNKKEGRGKKPVAPEKDVDEEDEEVEEEKEVSTRETSAKVTEGHSSSDSAKVSDAKSSKVRSKPKLKILRKIKSKSRGQGSSLSNESSKHSMEYISPKDRPRKIKRAVATSGNSIGLTKLQEHIKSKFGNFKISDKIDFKKAKPKSKEAPQAKTVPKDETSKAEKKSSPSPQTAVKQEMAEAKKASFAVPIPISQANAKSALLMNTGATVLRSIRGISPIKHSPFSAAEQTLQTAACDGFGTTGGSTVNVINRTIPANVAPAQRIDYSLIHQGIPLTQHHCIPPPVSSASANHVPHATPIAYNLSPQIAYFNSYQSGVPLQHLYTHAAFSHSPYGTAAAVPPPPMIHTATPYSMQTFPDHHTANANAARMQMRAPKETYTNETCDALLTLAVRASETHANKKKDAK